MSLIKRILWLVFGLIVYVILVFLKPIYMPPLSVILPSPEGFPGDARIVKSDSKDGSWWAYCRNLPSGFVWISSRSSGLSSPPVISFSYGRRCDFPFMLWRGRDRFGGRVGSLDTPAFSVLGEGLSVAIPGDTFLGITCPLAFEPAYYEKASAIIAEARSLRDEILLKHVDRLERATKVLANPEVSPPPGRSSNVIVCQIGSRDALRGNRRS